MPRHWRSFGITGPSRTRTITEEKEETLARRAEEMYARAHEVLERSPDAELVYVEPATISRLTPLSKA